jgi:hypothetical protein
MGGDAIPAAALRRGSPERVDSERIKKILAAIHNTWEINQKAWDQITLRSTFQTQHGQFAALQG